MDKDFSTGQRIKFRRKQLSISAEKLASVIGVSPATVYRWEKGDIEKVSSAVINPLADALQTTPAFLMGWNDDPEDHNTAGNISPVREKMIDLVMQIPENQLDQLAQIFQAIVEAAKK